MFELSVACKYLIPRRRQLSVSIISLISVSVIALVVWLVIVFFSVTDGLEKNWVEKLTILTAPIRVTPTKAYYQSYYYLVDRLSESSDYSSKTIKEKLQAPRTDPYDPAKDPELPPYWPPPETNKDGSAKDLVKLLFSAIGNLKEAQNIQAQDFELSATQLDLHLNRPLAFSPPSSRRSKTAQIGSHSTLSYPAYIGNFDPHQASWKKILLPIDTPDLNNFFLNLGAPLSETAAFPQRKEAALFQEELHHFLTYVSIQRLKTALSSWRLSPALYPDAGSFDALAIFKNDQIRELMLPAEKSMLPLLKDSWEEKGVSTRIVRLEFNQRALSSIKENKTALAFQQPILTLPYGTSFEATLDPSSIDQARSVADLRFDVKIAIQGKTLKGSLLARGLEIDQAQLISSHASDSASLQKPWWLSGAEISDGLASLPTHPQKGEGILLPKSFKEAGVLAGDRGHLSYASPTASILQEGQIPIYVAGFYDQGIIPIGGKFILANPEVASLIGASQQTDDASHLTNGVNIRFEPLSRADALKNELVEELKKLGIYSYWDVATYKEFDFTKEIIQELQSQKNLFMLIAVVILLVACSNIISMLIILVNDKKLEIGILRSMGATSLQIALIFGLSGALIGACGSLIGISAAVATLSHLDFLIGCLSRLQGHEMLSRHFYGETLPSAISAEALGFVLIVTICLSLIAGIVPAIKACLLRPAHILRSS